MTLAVKGSGKGRLVAADGSPALPSRQIQVGGQHIGTVQRVTGTDGSQLLRGGDGDRIRVRRPDLSLEGTAARHAVEVFFKQRRDRHIPRRHGEGDGGRHDVSQGDALRRPAGKDPALFCLGRKGNHVPFLVGIRRASGHRTLFGIYFYGKEVNRPVKIAQRQRGTVLLLYRPVKVKLIFIKFAQVLRNTPLPTVIASPHIYQPVLAQSHQMAVSPGGLHHMVGVNLHGLRQNRNSGTGIRRHQEFVISPRPKGSILMERDRAAAPSGRHIERGAAVIAGDLVGGGDLLTSGLLSDPRLAIVIPAPGVDAGFRPAHPGKDRPLPCPDVGQVPALRERDLFRSTDSNGKILIQTPAVDIISPKIHLARILRRAGAAYRDAQVPVVGTGQGSHICVVQLIHMIGSAVACFAAIPLGAPPCPYRAVIHQKYGAAIAEEKVLHAGIVGQNDLIRLFYIRIIIAHTQVLAAFAPGPECTVRFQRHNSAPAGVNIHYALQHRHGVIPVSFSAVAQLTVSVLAPGPYRSIFVQSGAEIFSRVHLGRHLQRLCRPRSGRQQRQKQCAGQNPGNHPFHHCHLSGIWLSPLYHLSIFPTISCQHSVFLPKTAKKQTGRGFPRSVCFQIIYSAKGCSTSAPPQ